MGAIWIRLIVSFFLLVINVSVFNAQEIIDLSDETNVYLFVDSKKMMWISSLNAINKYNSSETHNYWPNSIENPGLKEGISQSDFFEDENGDIWFSTINYLVKYVREKDQFISFEADAKGTEYRLICSTPQSHYLQIKNSIFRFLIKDEKFELLFEGFNGVDFSFELNENNELVELYGTRWNNGNGLLRLKKDSNNKFVCDTLFKDLEIKKIIALDDHKYITSTFGLHKFSDGEDLQLLFKDIKGLNKSFDNMLICSNGYELFKLVNEEFKLISNKYSSSYIINPSKDLFVLSDYNAGVKIVNTNITWQFEKTEFPLFELKNIEDRVFYSDSNGSVGELNSDGLQEIEILKSKASIVPLKDNFTALVISNERQFSISQKEILNSKTPLNIFKLRGGHYLNSDNVLIVGNNEIIIYNLEGKISNVKTDLNLMDVSYLDSENYLFNQNENGILIHKIEKNEIIRVKHISSNLSILQFYEKNDSIILLATDKGLMRLNKKSWLISNYKFNGKYIQSFVFDLNGDLWFGTRNALYHESQSGQTFMYNKKSGLPSPTFIQNCATIIPDGTLYFGTNKGILYFHPDSIKDIDYNPPMSLTSLKVHGHEWAEDTINIEVITNVELGHDQNTLTLDFVAIDYNKDNHPQYSVYLEGYDVDTTSLGDQSKITYPNLQPGNYRFYYSACTLSGYCRDEFETFDFTINPPYWETWWFRTLGVLAGLGIIGFGIGLYLRNRLREQRFVFEKQQLVLKTELQLQQERNRIADELHDELGGKLSSIKFAGKKVQKATHIDEVKKITARVSEISTELIESMRSIIWAMDTQNDTLSSLQANIRSYASIIGRDNDLKMYFKFEETDEDIIVKGQIRHHLFLTIKELLNNIIKHSSADEIELTMTANDHSLKTIISENGQGFTLNDISNYGKGIKSIDKRMTTINSKIAYNNTDKMRISITTPLS